MRREVKDFIAARENEGWEYVGLSGGGHHKMKLPSGHSFCVPATPSDHRSLLNTKTDMRRYKAQVESRKA